MGHYEIAQTFAEQVKAEFNIPGELRWLTAAYEAFDGTSAEFNASDAAPFNVAIGTSGTATFTIADAKAATPEIMRRVAKDILGMTAEEKAAQVALEQAERQLQEIANAREKQTQKEQQAVAQIEEKRAALAGEEARVQTQAAADRAALDAIEQHWRNYKQSVERVGEVIEAGK
jgi:K+-transporting ATPase c subunit